MDAGLSRTSAKKSNDVNVNSEYTGGALKDVDAARAILVEDATSDDAEESASPSAEKRRPCYDDSNDHREPVQVDNHSQAQERGVFRPCFEPRNLAKSPLPSKAVLEEVV